MFLTLQVGWGEGPLLWSEAQRRALPVGWLVEASHWSGAQMARQHWGEDASGAFIAPLTAFCIASMFLYDWCYLYCLPVPNYSRHVSQTPSSLCRTEEITLAQVSQSTPFLNNTSRQNVSFRNYCFKIKKRFSVCAPLCLYWSKLGGFTLYLVFLITHFYVSIPCRQKRKLCSKTAIKHFFVSANTNAFK